MAIKKYTKGKAIKLSENFNSTEFDCKCGAACSSTLIDEALVVFLQQIRNYFKKPITITSGYRCAAHNKEVGGATNSYHSKGQAADIVVYGVSPQEVAKYAESIGVKGIGLYDSFVHIDTRTSKSFWYSSKQEYRATFGGNSSAAAITVSLPTLNSKETQLARRSIGIGVIGEAEWLAQNHIMYGSDEHKHSVIDIYGNVSNAIEDTSKELAKEKGSCIIDGIRNAYGMAIAPNTSSGLLAGSTCSCEPIYAREWAENSKLGTYKMVAPHVTVDNLKYYPNAYELDQGRLLELTALRQKYVDINSIYFSRNCNRWTYWRFSIKINWFMVACIWSRIWFKSTIISRFKYN